MITLKIKKDFVIDDSGDYYKFYSDDIINISDLEDEIRDEVYDEIRDDVEDEISDLENKIVELEEIIEDSFAFQQNNLIDIQLNDELNRLIKEKGTLYLLKLFESL